jgi:phosphoglycolate phosphatase-like HAD superfamily hydrolase
METKHTPEPWDYELGHDMKYQQPIAKICNRQYVEIVTVWSRRPDGFDIEAASATAKRIVECVNAFEGIENPAEFMQVVRILELDAYKQLETKHTNVLQVLETLEHLLSNGNSINPNAVIRSAIQMAIGKINP